MSDAPLLEVRRVTKRFPGVLALHDVNLTLDSGEVLAVIGENGAGKSTLMKILAGVQPLDVGQILMDGKPVEIGSVRGALQLGISLIHQELNLADNLEVGANIFLGREPRTFGCVNRQTIQQESQKYLDMIGLDIAPDTLVSRLTIGHQQMVEIAKAVSVNSRVLIMDEPTSSLSARETESLFRVVRELRKRGVSIIYISHRLGEVKEIADRVTVLRDGENAGDLRHEAIEHESMVRLMVGRDISQFYVRKQHDVGEPVFEVENLVTSSWPQHKLNFNVAAGEIVGVAGLVGAGRTELLQTLFGVDQPLSGRMRIDGELVGYRSPIGAIQCGLALVPEDRKRHGLVVEMNVRENVGLAGLRRNHLVAGILNQSAEQQDTKSMITKLNIKTPDDEQIVQFLSGGNQQKVVLGKWLSLKPKVLLLDEPTRGIDVGAKQEIYCLMEDLAGQGIGILFVSSEMEEILGMSDRVLVMHEGRINGCLQREQLSEEAVMRLATGRRVEESIGLRNSVDSGG